MTATPSTSDGGTVLLSTREKPRIGNFMTKEPSPRPINGGVVALLSAAASIVLAVIVEVIVRKLRKRERDKENPA